MKNSYFVEINPAQRNRLNSLPIQNEKTAGIYGKKTPYSAKPSITTGARCRTSLPRLGLLLGMGAGGGRWGR
jgi:hypothetical protein